MPRRHKKQEHHAENHGGSWKIAYADFITTMMAFFLLMWLLSVTSEEQRKGISDYFLGIAPPIEAPKFFGESSNKPAELNSTQESPPLAEEPTATEAATEENKTNAFTGSSLSLSTQQQETQMFKAVEEAILKAVKSKSELRELAGHLIIEQTDEGLKIQIIDQGNRSLFASGSAEMLAHTKKLIRVLGDALKKTPNPILLAGHTDAAPFMRDKKYGNWELSFDRANSCRYALMDLGIAPERILSVSGKESKDPLLKNEPLSPQNRRISLILLRSAPPLRPSSP